MIVYSKYNNRRRALEFRPAVSKRTVLIVLICIATVLLLLRVATWLNAQEMFVLKNIDVEGNRFVKKSEVLDLLNLDTSRSLFDYNLRQIAQQVSMHPFIKDASVSRRLPDNLIIRISEKEPIAILNQSELSLVDENGEQLPEFNSVELLDYPIISNLVLADEQNGGKEVMEVLRFLRQTREHNFVLYSQISEISFSKNLGVYFYLTENAITVIVGKDRFAQKAANLLQVLNILKMDGGMSQVEYFDLRFEGQVVVKELDAT